MLFPVLHSGWCCSDWLLDGAGSWFYGVWTDVEDAGSVRHGSMLGRWERARHLPSSPRRGLVGGYHGYRQRMDVPAVHRGVPLASMLLVVNSGPTQTVTTVGRPSSGVTVGSFVAGLYEAPVLIDAVESHGIQIDLCPVADMRLLGVQAREFVGQTLLLDAVFGAVSDRLVDDLAGLPCGSWATATTTRRNIKARGHAPAGYDARAVNRPQRLAQDRFSCL